MNDLARRMAALSPEKLALLERRLNKRHSENGDLARPLPDSNLELLTKADDSGAKRRDTPVEMVKIQAVLEQCPAVREATCVSREDGPGESRLIAYIVPDHRQSRPVRQLLRLESKDGFLGLRYELPNGMFIIHLNRSETDYIYREIFEEQSYLKHGITLPERACVFDAGAHIGLFTLFVNQVSRGAEVYAFEPVPPIFDVLRLNTFIYDVNVKLFNVGLAKESGTVLFSYYPHASVLSGRYADASAERETVKASLHTQQRLGIGEMGLSDEEINEILEARLTTERFTCPVKTLSQVIRENGVEKIDLLKIDVEKSELDVLYGIDEEDWPKIRQLVIEAHDIDGRLVLITDSLKRHGYQLTVEQDVMLKETGLYNIYAVRRPKGETASIANGHRPVSNPNWRWNSSEKFVSGVRQFAGERLPAYLVPDEFVPLNVLPRTPDGQIDHSALPSPDMTRSGRKEGHVIPRTGAEEAVARIWTEVLGLEHIGVHDNFFESGGDRLLAIKVISCVRDTFHVELPQQSLSEWPTIAELASAVMESQGDTKESHFDGAAMRDGEEQMAAHIDRLSDEDVNSLLGHLFSEEKEAVAEVALVSPALAVTQSEPRFQTVDVISRVERGGDKELLTNLSRLSDEDVDSLLANMFTVEEILKEYRAMKSGLAIWTQNGLGEERSSTETYSQSQPRTDRDATQRSLSDAPMNIDRAFEESYLTYVWRLHEAWMSAQHVTWSAHFAYMIAMQPAWTHLGNQHLAEEAYQNYVESLEEMRSNVRKRFEEAYADYLRALRATWEQPDIATITPGLLFEVSQEMAMASHFAMGALNSLALIGG